MKYIILLCLGVAFGQNAWVPQVSGTQNTLYDVAYGDSGYVAVGALGTVLTSPDGIAWTPQNSGTSKTFRSVAFSGTRFLAVGDSVTRVSSNGVVWSNYFNTPSFFNETAWGNGQFVSVGPQNVMVGFGERILNGVFLLSLSWNGNRYVAVGRGGKVRTSPDGASWTAESTGNTDDLSGVVWDGNQYVAVSPLGWVRLSPDASTWSAHYSGSNLNSVAFGASTLVACGVGGAIRISTDGTTWLARTSGVSEYLMRVRFAGGRFIAVGDLGTILTSSPPTAIFSRPARPRVSRPLAILDLRGRRVQRVTSFPVFRGASIP